MPPYPLTATASPVRYTIRAGWVALADAPAGRHVTSDEAGRLLRASVQYAHIDKPASVSHDEQATKGGQRRLPRGLRSAMELVKTVLRLDFESPTKPWLEIRAMLRFAGGDPAAEVGAPPIVVDLATERKRIVVQLRAVSMEHEMPGSTETSISDAVRLMSGLNDASEFPAISRIRHDAIFIEPFPIPFHELVDFLKKRYLMPNSLAGAATDIGLIFDVHEAAAKKHVQVGPMDATQLRSEILRWPPEGLPDTFVFLGLRHESAQEVQFSPDSLHTLLRTALEWETVQAEAIVGELKAEER